MHSHEDRGPAVGPPLDAVALAGEVRAGRRSATDVVTTALSAAGARAELGAFWSLADARALERAGELDAGAAPECPLAGVPLSVKDGFDLAGLPTTGGLRGRHRPAGADAAAVRRLERAGAIAIGKTAMDPLAWTTHGQAEGFPPCVNPIDPTLSPGGSSSGSAVSVAAGIVPLALGTDTAGSVRIPAAYCGVVGLKPAFGAVSLEGCLPLSASCDTVGVLSSTVRGCAAAYDALVGGSATSKAAVASGLPRGPIGIFSDLFESSDPSVAAACADALERLESSGEALVDVRLGWSASGLGLVLAVEFAAAWGARADADPGSFSSEMLNAIERARMIPPSRYEQVCRELRAAREHLKRRLGSFRALVSPTVPVPVPTLEEEDVAVSTRFTRIFNGLGWPAMSVPCGRDGRGRPVGMHLATAGAIQNVVAVAALVQQQTCA